MKKKIIVVGAGIIGASLAYHLSRAGTEVLVFEAKHKSGGVATPNSFAWINASWGNVPAYVKLRMRAMAEWRSLKMLHSDLAVNWCGGLLWDLPVAELHEFKLQHQALGYDVKLVTAAQIATLEPALIDRPALAVHVAEEGAIEPVGAVRGFLSAALALGATLRKNVEVLRVLQVGNRIIGVETSAGAFRADEVVLAAGVQTKSLLETCGIKLNLDAPAGLLVYSKPIANCISGLILAPHIHVRQTAAGRLVAGSDFGGAQPGDDPTKAAENLFGVLREFLRVQVDMEMDYYTVGYRPTPADGLPAIGRPANLEGLYIAVMHSGITLAPIVGLFGADEIVNDIRDPLLTLTQPDRLIV